MITIVYSTHKDQEYNNKFKKWTPVSLAGKNDRIISISALKNY